jgi:PBSX family phage terminase large subunit
LLSAALRTVFVRVVEVLLSDKQRSSIAQANARQNIWEGAIRSSKSVAADYRWILYMDEVPDTGHPIMVGKTLASLRRNVLIPIQNLLGPSNFSFSVASLEATMWGKKIQLVGASDERAEGKIRGMTVSGAYCDEITLWPENFYNQLLGRMSVKGAKLFGTTNPDNPKHWLKKNYLDRSEELGIKVFHFSIDDNPFLDPEFVSSLKKEYTGLWYKRFIDGLWVAAEGAVYDFFTENEHLLNPANEPVAAWQDFSIDYGTNNPAAFLHFCHNSQTMPRAWLKKTYRYSAEESLRRKTDTELADDFERFTGGSKRWPVILDPSAASFKAELLSRGYKVRGAKNDVLEGIQTVSRMLKTGQYKILDVPENRPVIDEKYSYSWDPKAADRGVDKVIKKEDHCSDAERYDLHTNYDLAAVDYGLLTTF